MSDDMIPDEMCVVPMHEVCALRASLSRETAARGRAERLLAHMEFCADCANAPWQDSGCEAGLEAYALLHGGAALAGSEGGDHG